MEPEKPSVTIKEMPSMSLAERSSQLWAFLSGMGLHIQSIRPADNECGLVAMVVSVGPLPFEIVAVPKELPDGDDASESATPNSEIPQGGNIVPFPSA